MRPPVKVPWVIDRPLQPLADKHGGRTIVHRMRLCFMPLFAAVHVLSYKISHDTITLCGRFGKIKRPGVAAFSTFLGIGRLIAPAMTYAIHLTGMSVIAMLGVIGNPRLRKCDLTAIKIKQQLIASVIVRRAPIDPHGG